MTAAAPSSSISTANSRIALPAFILATILLSWFVSFWVYPNILADTGREIGYDEYDYLGWNLAQGKGFRSDHGEESVIRGPGYPVFLATVYALSGGHNHWLAQLLQGLLSGATVWLTWLLARDLFGARIALWAAGMTALHPLFIWFSARIYAESFLTFFQTLSLYFLVRMVERQTWGRLLALALALTVSVYVKSLSLFLLPIMLIFLWLRRIGFLRALGWTAAATTIVALLIAPWTWRNYQVTGRIVPVHASSALPLLSGHYEALAFFESPLSQQKGIHDSFDAFPIVTESQGLPPAHYPYRSLAEELNIETATNGFMLEYYRTQPHMFFVNSFLRFLMFWYLGQTPMLSIIMIGVSAATLTFIAFGWGRLPRGYGRGIFLATVALYVGIHALIIGQARMQVMIVPLLMTLAAPGLIALRDTLRGRRKEAA